MDQIWKNRFLIACKDKLLITKVTSHTLILKISKQSLAEAAAFPFPK